MREGLGGRERVPHIVVLAAVGGVKSFPTNTLPASGLWLRWPLVSVSVSDLRPQKRRHQESDLGLGGPLLNPPHHVGLGLPSANNLIFSRPRASSSFRQQLDEMSDRKAPLPPPLQCRSLSRTAPRARSVCPVPRARSLLFSFLLRLPSRCPSSLRPPCLLPSPPLVLRSRRSLSKSCCGRYALQACESLLLS